jgi:predicted enzyme related to lactoylglutathione lyase
MSTPESSNASQECAKPGKIGWAELVTSDVDAAIKFYTGLFGWEVEKFPMASHDYTMFKHDGIPFGGVMTKPRPEVPTHWLNYVKVEDIDASIAQATSLGGSTIFGPEEIPGVGKIAVIHDPQGAVIGFHQNMPN